MDISKASNFERFLYDLFWRDPAAVRELMRKVEHEGGFNVAECGEVWKRLPGFGFLSGRSTHANRIQIIRDVWQKYQIEIDTHTADGIKVGLEKREPGVPLICLETALPAKFAETIREALGHEPARPARFENLEKLPQRFQVIEPHDEVVKRYIAAHAF